MKSNGGFYEEGMRWLSPKHSHNKHPASHSVMQIRNEFTASPLR